MGLLEIAAATLFGGERGVETTARNVSNANTAGYKREISFSELANPTEVVNSSSAGGTIYSEPIAPSLPTVTVEKQASLTDSGNRLDLAINGPAMVLVRAGDHYFLTRAGQFSLSSGGALTDAMGRILQQAGGGDLEVPNANVEILVDGTVLAGDVPVGAVGLYRPEQGDRQHSFSADKVGSLIEDRGSELLQGMLERSNVELSDEMVSLMRSQRQVESGAQLVRAYDQLMGQAISTFSRSK